MGDTRPFFFDIRVGREPYPLGRPRALRQQCAIELRVPPSQAGTSAEARRRRRLPRRQMCSGVALERQDCVIAHHSAAVVGDPHEPAPSELNVDLHPRGTGIDRVLHQLFDDRCRALDDLAGRDLVSKIVR